MNGVKSISNSKHYLYNYCYLCYIGNKIDRDEENFKRYGSIYFHCDPTVSHYVKIMMDTIFGEDNFRNEIVWQRNDKRGKGSQFIVKNMGLILILFYFTRKRIILLLA